ncbi:MAG TPA: MaoC family dehydratase [Burkholderiales bacterium]|jgi:acyl dehydratase|nr:MaoC family dehydratase [Burkholderiales bacterium]
MAIKYYWEDLVPGEAVGIGSYTVGADEIITFAKQFDPQPFHVDPEAAKGSIFGGLIASGWHTCGIAMRLMCDAYLNETASLGSPGLEEIRWLKPVRPGDTLRGTRTIEESRPTSKPDRGLVLTRWDMYNQKDEHVLMMRGYGLFGRRPA